MKINYNRILDVFISDIIPKTYKNVERGNKIFGGALFLKSNMSLKIIGLNNEIKNPLLHGEVSTINKFFNSKKKLNPKKYIFVSTHQPCSLCLSAITWAGFNNFYYLFPYKDTKDRFSIPHDLNIMSQIFKIKNGLYNNENDYWKSFSIIKEINKLETRKIKQLYIKIQKIYQEYEILSLKYQKNKKINNIPLK